LRRNAAKTPPPRFLARRPLLPYGKDAGEPREQAKAGTGARLGMTVPQIMREIGLFYYHGFIGWDAELFEPFSTALFIADVNFTSDFSNFQRTLSGDDYDAVTITYN